MSFWQTYYHIVWATKQRQPLIKIEQEMELYNYIIGKSDFLKCIVHAIGGMEDHIHLVVSIPPTIAISEFVKKIKGSSSHHLNHTNTERHEKFAWQDGYSLFSLGSKQLNDAIFYVKNQKIHHLQQKTNIYLESTDV
jgi:putative transposase